MAPIHFFKILIPYFLWIIFTQSITYESFTEISQITSFDPNDVIVQIDSPALFECFIASQQISGCKSVAFKESKCYILMETAVIIRNKDINNYEFMHANMTERCKKVSGLPNCIVDIKFNNLRPNLTEAQDSLCNIIIEDNSIPSFCYFQNGGWIVIQQRVDDSVDFNRDWNDYVQGFGSPSGNFWIGLENMHILTNSTTMELMVDLYTFDGDYAYAIYDHFFVDDSSTNYILQLGSYSGTAKDSFSYHSNNPFTTYDRDNDGKSSNCAEEFSSGWWYKRCFGCNLNGKYRNGRHSDYAQGINWRLYKGFYISMKKVVMKLREKI